MRRRFSRRRRYGVGRPVRRPVRRRRRTRIRVGYRM